MLTRHPMKALGTAGLRACLGEEDEQAEFRDHLAGGEAAVAMGPMRLQPEDKTDDESVPAAEPIEKYSAGRGQDATHRSRCRLPCPGPGRPIQVGETVRRVTENLVISAIFEVSDDVRTRSPSWRTRSAPPPCVDVASAHA